MVQADHIKPCIPPQKVRHWRPVYYIWPTYTGTIIAFTRRRVPLLSASLAKQHNQKRNTQVKDIVLGWPFARVVEAKLNKNSFVRSATVKFVNLSPDPLLELYSEEISQEIPCELLDHTLLNKLEK